MPKLKTHKGAAKRFRLTATGKVKRGHSHARHILTKKTNKRKRLLDIDGSGFKVGPRARHEDAAVRKRLRIERLSLSSRSRDAT